MRHFPRLLLALLLMPTLLVSSRANSAEKSSADLEQQALQAATDAVANSVVQIRTVGGLDRIGKTMLSQGPTTGLILSEDGYIVSSAYNFAGHPSTILVRLADGQQLPAELISRDKNRMLVLLKVVSKRRLPVPQPAASPDIHVGQWAIALGRTFQAEEVGVSVGIVSALHRKYGRVLQTDASVSVANYGGPLVNISGQVLGVLVPMSPQSTPGGEEDELAGAEYYDSGIGFAVPLEHVLSILERWKHSKELLPGKLGIGLTEGDTHTTPPKITSVWPNSPAAKAGWKSGDLVTAVNKQPVTTQAHLRFQIKPRYAGDTVSVTLERDKEILQTEVTLTGNLPPYRLAFLGVLPVRSPTKDTPAGAAIRDVWPDSPASEAGLQPDDSITKINDSVIKSAADAHNALAGLQPGQTAKLLVVRGKEQLTLTAKLTTLPESILPSTVNPPATNNRGEDTKLKTIKLPEFSQESVYFSPATAKAGKHGLLLWLGDGNAEHNQSLVDVWQAICRRDGLILLIAPPQKENSWKSEDLPYLKKLAQAASKRFALDSRRTVIAGQGKAGQLAYALALKSRNTFAGVISIDAPLPRTLKPRQTSPSNRLAVLTIEPKSSNFAPLIRRDIKTLRAAGYPTIWLQCPPNNDVTPKALPRKLDSQTRESLGRWIDGLDRF